jgi:class 3 adenylate cyclase
MSPEERTVVFSDIAGSTRIIETVGDVQGHQVVTSVLACLADVTGRHRGTVVKTIGDEIMSAFADPADALAAAVDMQRSLRDRGPMHGVHAKVRIGVHGGPVLIENGDLHGDVVNTAARVVAMAKGDQILTTEDTLRTIDVPDVDQRDLGEHPLKGKDAPVRIKEVLWEADLTGVTTVLPSFATFGPATLELHVGGDTLTFAGSRSMPITIGRGEGSTVEIQDAAASRSHASVSARHGRFYLVDHSTNGTYVLPAGESEIFVHRDEVLLRGSGEIRLGRSAAEGAEPALEYGVRGG